ncbi:Na+/H+ antiporter subunit D [Kurthia sibirica]|uniref:Na+/H+ antiporter subunit D n=1 Tax=Kurthia sibirica TaxID=202750 RepID=A0A2U3AQ75_9BACL|nr:Na+/H+ antiporter subunit D [Kurthia sibirica]PWI26692.1 Na+/H+ antiporter subunit D [Kurthia sibirica]GEK32961.1 Na+/H+ antiporter subunit D [Kurthia sibirica]
MNNLIVLPLILPIFIAVILIFFRQQIRIQRILTFSTLLLLIIVNIYLLIQVKVNGIQVLQFGGWEAPFGISFVADAFAMLLVLTTSIVAFLCMIYAFSSLGETFEKMFVYPLVLLMIGGINGSFLTGDLFNLFVCFEVMLLASYVLITLGGGKERLRESIKYVVINVLASWFFLVGLAMIYGTLGTLNMAHLAQRVAEVNQGPLLTTIALLFLVVFALKAGLLLFFWLPGSYRVPTTPIAAMFGALLTKVGIYAIFRMFTLIFPLETNITHTLIGVMAIATIIFGCFGVMGFKDLRQIVAYNVIISVGFVLLGLYANTTESLEGAVFYLMHDMLIKALLFLMIGTIIYITGRTSFDEIKGLIHQFPLFGWLFFIMMLSLAGIPPLSGFIGKLLIGQGLIDKGAYIAIGIGFLSSVIVLYSLLRIFLKSIFGEATYNQKFKTKIPKMMLVPMVTFGLLTLVLGVGAEIMMPYVEDAARVLTNPEIYINAVLNP